MRECHLIDLDTDHNQFLLSSPAEQNGWNYYYYYYFFFINSKNVCAKEFLFFLNSKKENLGNDMAKTKKKKHEQYVYTQGSRSWMTSFSFVLVYNYISFFPRFSGGWGLVSFAVSERNLRTPDR